MHEKDEKRNYYKLIRILSTLVALLATVVTIVIFIIQMRAEKIEIDAQVMASEELTTSAPEAELKANYTWAGEEVSYLWKIRINFINSGDKTIIGKGSQKNILNDGLNFVFPEKTRILRVQTENENFKNTIIWTMNQFQIRFSQWRAQEYITACFYISSEEAMTKSPSLIILSRDIIDGNVSVQYLKVDKPSEHLFLIDRIPRIISQPSKLFGGVFAVAITILLLLSLVFLWKSWIRSIIWKKNNLSEFIIYLKKIKHSLTIKKFKLYERNPSLLPEEFWANFKGSRAPRLLFGIRDAIPATILLIIMILGFMSLILMLIPA